MKRSAQLPDPFRFGWRYQSQIGADGSKQSVQVPLTLDDVLHPRRNDEIPQNTWHARACRYLCTVLSWRLASNPRAMVLSDCLVDWGIRGLGNHSPDISVFDDVSDPDRNRWIVSVAQEKVRPILVIEIVSPDSYERQARDNDVVTKVREYYRAGVPLYFIVDQKREDGPHKVLGYQRGARKFVRIRPDQHGCLLMAPVRLLMGLRDERVVCWGTDSGEEIVTLIAKVQPRDAVAQARQAAEAALAEALARIRALEAQQRRNGDPHST